MIASKAQTDSRWIRREFWIEEKQIRRYIAEEREKKGDLPY